MKYGEADGVSNEEAGETWIRFLSGQVAELVYAHALGACGAILEGSSPSLPTIFFLPS